MPEHLFILVGAGASYDCVSENIAGVRAERRPPLTAQLFDMRFEETLHEYPLAEAAGASIQPLIKGSAFRLEEFLREELRDSEHLHLRQQFRGVPLYLQHLLFDISMWDWPDRGYTPHPDNYNLLVTQALKIPETIFITLNYDLLLDKRLFVYEGGPTKMESYIASPRWSLIKPHGSVNWGRQVTAGWERPEGDPFFADTVRAMGDGLEVASNITLRSGPTVQKVRIEGEGASWSTGQLFYPALSAPLGAGDELVCPPEHVRHLRERLRAYDGLNLLVIGYSGLDDEVLKLLRESENHIRWLAIVSDSLERAQVTKTAVARGAGLSGPTQYFKKGFNDFVQSGDLEQVLATLP